MKKGQTEAIGLVIIIILLFLGMLFVVKFVFLKPVSEVKDTYARMQLASNIISTLLETNTNCTGLSFKDLFIDSAGSTPSINCPDGRGSREFVDQETAAIFERTLGEWKMGYQFRLYDSSNNNYTQLNSSLGCQGSKDVTSKTFPIPSGTTSTIFFKLDICE